MTSNDANYWKTHSYLCAALSAFFFVAVVDGVLKMVRNHDFGYWPILVIFAFVAVKNLFSALYAAKNAEKLTRGEKRP